MKTSERNPILSVTKKDCRWDYYVGSGKGGQKRNKTSNCVRCTHVASGAIGKSEDGRSQAHNKKIAFKKMAESPKFKLWVRTETSRILGRETELEMEVENSMCRKNLKIETRDENGKWKENK